MKQDIADIKAQIEALQAQLVDADKQARIEAVAAFNAIPADYDYIVTWVHPSKCRIDRKATSAYQAAVDAVHNSALGLTHLKPFEGGMSYVLLDGGYIMPVSGGSIVCNFHRGENVRCFDKIAPISQDDIASLRGGIVPDWCKLK